MSVVILLALGLALLVALLLVDMGEVAVFIAAAILLMAVSAVWLDLAGVFATMGVGVAVLVVALIWRLNRERSRPATRAPHEMGTRPDGA